MLFLNVPQQGDQSCDDPYKIAFYEDKVQNLQSSLDGIYAELNEGVWKKNYARDYFESNRCTKYYFRLPGTKHDAIKCLYNLEGELITQPKDILAECRNYYKYLYTQPNVFCDRAIKNKFLAGIPQNKLSSLELHSLGKDFSLDELHSALKAMNTAAVPGEDGLTVNFYLTFWNDIKIFLWNSFIHAFDMGSLSLTQ